MARCGCSTFARQEEEEELKEQQRRDEEERRRRQQRRLLRAYHISREDKQGGYEFELPDELQASCLPPHPFCPGPPPLVALAITETFACQASCSYYRHHHPRHARLRPAPRQELSKAALREEVEKEDRRRAARLFDEDDEWDDEVEWQTPWAMPLQSVIWCGMRGVRSHAISHDLARTSQLAVATLE
jgi:hypothetical protein